MFWAEDIRLRKTFDNVENSIIIEKTNKIYKEFIEEGFYRLSKLKKVNNFRLREMHNNILIVESLLGDIFHIDLDGKNLYCTNGKYLLVEEDAKEIYRESIGIRTNDTLKKVICFNLINANILKSGKVQYINSELDAYKRVINKWNTAYKYNLKAKILNTNLCTLINNQVYVIVNANSKLVYIPKEARHVLSTYSRYHSHLEECKEAVIKGNIDLEELELSYSGIESIKIYNDKITKIPKGFASRCRNLTEVILPDSISHIDEAAFFTCYRLEKINIPKSLKYIGKRAFYGCYKILDFTFPDNKGFKLEEEAINNCVFIKHIYIPKDTIELDLSIFYEWKDDTTIEIHRSTLDRLTSHLPKDENGIPKTFKNGYGAFMTVNLKLLDD